MSTHVDVRAMDPASCSPTAAPPKRHILLVEDDAAASAAFCRVLRGAGYEVSAAFEFRLALEILEAECPLDLMLVDIVMPDSVNGLALSRMARMRRKDLKIIYLTGYDIRGAEREALGPILRKPVDGAQLLAEVERVLTTS